MLYLEGIIKKRLFKFFIKCYSSSKEKKTCLVSQNKRKIIHNNNLSVEATNKIKKNFHPFYRTFFPRKKKKKAIYGHQIT